MTLADISTELLVRELRTRPDLPTAIDSTTVAERDVETEQILLAVADAFNCPLCRLFRPSRSPAVVRSRAVAIVLLRRRTGLTTVEIGEIFHQDRCTVIHACQAHSRRMECDPTYAANYRRAKSILAAA